MEKISRIWILIFFGILFPFTLEAQQDHYFIATGSRGGNYYKYGQYIARRYNETIPGKFSIIETTGSHENINMLWNNEVDFALVQRDVLLESMYDEEKGIKNVEVVIPLFQEKLWIYHLGPQDINIRQIADNKSDKPLVLGFTGKNSTSYKVMNILLKFLNIDRSRFHESIKNYDSLSKDFVNGKIDYLVSFSLPLPGMDTLKNLHYVYLNEEDARILQNRLHNVYVTSIAPEKYTLGSWSFLVGRKKVLAGITSPNILIKSLISKPKDSTLLTYYKTIKQSFDRFLSKDRNEVEQLNNIPIFPGFKKYLGWRSVNWMPYWILLALVLLILFLHYYYTGKWFPKYNLLFFWNRYKHFQLGFIALILIYFGSIELLIWAERRFYEDIGIKSQILNMTRPDLHSWLFVTTVTGNSNGVFPLSTLGKLMLSLNSLNFWIGTILIGVSEYATYKMTQKRKKGLMKTHFENHLIIFGWNGNTGKFITGLLQDAKEYNNKKMKIVCVVPDIKKIRESDQQIKDLHDNKVIDIIQGDARDFHILEKANTHKADTIILLAEDSSKIADERTQLRALAISRFVKEKLYGQVYETKGIIRKVKKFLRIGKGNKKEEEEKGYDTFDIGRMSDPIYMIAEINHEEFRDTLVDADVNEIVVAGNYRKAIMKQAVFNHGISKVLDEIMQYNDYNEFYKIDLSLPENSHLVGKTFDELLVLLRKVGILLVGVHIIFHDKNDNIIIDRNMVQYLLHKHEPGITRDVIVNPVDPVERNRPVDGDDHLIVLAYNAKQLREGVKRLKREMEKFTNI